MINEIKSVKNIPRSFVRKCSELKSEPCFIFRDTSIYVGSSPEVKSVIKYLLNNPKAILWGIEFLFKPVLHLVVEYVFVFVHF